MAYDVVVVDSNNAYYARYEVHKEETYSIGSKTIVTGGIRGFLQSFNKWKREYAHKDTVFYFLFDNPTSKTNLRQQMIDPSYKEQRKKMPKSFYRSIDYLRLILESYDENIYCIYGTGYEADDIVPYVLKNVEKDSKVLLISEDMDWSRLISKNVHQFMKKKIFTPKEFLNKYEFSPTLEKVVLYKVIRGDTVDEIPIGVPNLSKKILLRLMDDYKDIYYIFDNLRNIDYLNDHWKNVFIQNKDRLILNHQLVSFFRLEENYIRECTSEGKFKPEHLKILYNSLGFDLYKIDQRVHTYFKIKEMEKKGYTEGFLMPPDTYMLRK